MATISKVIIVCGGELSNDIAEQIMSKKPPSLSSMESSIRKMSERPKTLVSDYDSSTLLCFVVQTVENAAPAEDAGSCVRFFKRKTHPTGLCEDRFCFTVFGVGDSNLLLDRQTTTAKDCNQVAQELDSRLQTLGAVRHYPLGLADERTGLTEVDGWIESFWSNLEN